MSSARPVFHESDFRKASASNPDRQCVRVARKEGWVEVRDDKTLFGAVDDHRLLLTSTEFDALLTGLRVGDTAGQCLDITQRHDGSYRVRSAHSGDSTYLHFTAGEMAAFLDGVSRGEFDIDTDKQVVTNPSAPAHKNDLTPTASSKSPAHALPRQ